MSIDRGSVRLDLESHGPGSERRRYGLEGGDKPDTRSHEVERSKVDAVARSAADEVLEVSEISPDAELPARDHHDPDTDVQSQMVVREAIRADMFTHQPEPAGDIGTQHLPTTPASIPIEPRDNDVPHDRRQTVLAVPTRVAEEARRVIDIELNTNWRACEIADVADEVRSGLRIRTPEAHANTHVDVASLRIRRTGNCRDEHDG